MLEYLKKRLYKHGNYLYDSDNKELFHIVNKIDLRHQDPDQHGNYDKDVWYDWFFTHTCFYSCSVET